MYRFKMIYIIFSIVSLLFSNEESWTTTTFEYYWNSAFNRIRFREPVNFTPFEARVGYLTYGGSDYWNNPLSTNLGDKSPVILDRTNNSFEYLKPYSARVLAFVEFDFIKLNWPNFIFKKFGLSQNFLDIQTGLGYRYIHSISEPTLPNYWITNKPGAENAGNFVFKPRLHDFNINSSIDYQPLARFRLFLYHSIGYSLGTIYEYTGTGTYLSCTGLSESLGLGIRYVRNFEKYDFNLVYGIEARIHRSYIDKIEDPSKISHIVGLDMYSKGLIFSIGTIFGGQKTSADYSFLKMLNENYISAEPGFRNYIENKDTPPRKKLAKKMWTFTKTQIPYQQYKNGLHHQYLGDLDSAIYWFNKSEQLANGDLLFEINAHKKDLAIMLVDSVNIYKRTMTFKTAEDIILKAKNLVGDYYYIDEMLADLYIEKGDVLERVGNFSKAYMYYNKSKQVYPESDVELIQKYYSLADNLIKQAELASNNSDYILAIESLNFALDIRPDKSSELNSIIDDLHLKLSKEESIEIKERIKAVVENKKNEIANSINKKILIGMSSNEVENAIGVPNIKDSLKQGNRAYELWTYTSRNKRIYFEENLVIKVE